MKKQFWPKSRQSRSQEQKRIAAKVIYFFAEKKKIEWKFRKEKESFFSTGSKKFEPEGWSARMKRFRPDLAADDRVRFNHDTHVTQLWRCCDAFQNSTATRDTQLTTQGGERRLRKERTFPGKQKYFFVPGVWTCSEFRHMLFASTCRLPSGPRPTMPQRCPSRRRRQRRRQLRSLSRLPTEETRSTTA